MLPTAMSLFATLCSASTLLGIPVEIYYYGISYLYFILCWLIASYVASHIFIPKFRELGYISLYTYVEKRFSLTLRISVTLTFIISFMLFMAVILYGPSLALSQVIGIDLWLAIVSSGIICTFYTSIGGMKAVIWTDVIQTLIIFSGVLLSIVFGFMDTGGVKKVFETAYLNQRMNLFNISFDPTVRYTVWSLMIGGTFYATSCSCILQTQTQRYMSVNSTRDAQKATWINNIMLGILLFLCCIVGLLVHAKYHDCDPLGAKLVSKSDQIYPLFVMETFKRFPGLTGLFMASILSGSLSSISSGVNSITAVIIEDIWKRLTPNQPLSDKTQTIISKYTSFTLGVITVLLAFIVSYLPSILALVYSVIGTLTAPIFGIFLLGFYFPRVNNRSALIAFFISLVFQLWVLIGASFTVHQQLRRSLPTSVNGCTSLNITLKTPLIISQNLSSPNFFLPLYSISFIWYAFNGVSITVIMGLACSLLWYNSKSDIEKIDQSLLMSCRRNACCGSLSTKSLDNPEVTMAVNSQGTRNKDAEHEHMDPTATNKKELVTLLSSEN
ncbi:unnamed protein product [Adineta ricciae]|nr:unnamed protein product [Adineta ricciae]